MSSVFIASFSFLWGENRSPPLNLQGRLHVAHCECVIGHVLPKFTFRHRACFLIPDVAGDLPRRIWLAIHRNAKNNIFLVPERSTPPVMFERFYDASLCGVNGHVAARITLKDLFWKVG